MNMPPTAVLAAALYTLSEALVYSRNLTGSPSAEAAPLIPGPIIAWLRASINELHMYFGCINHHRWEGAPDLVGIFERKLAECIRAAQSVSVE